MHSVVESLSSIVLYHLGEPSAATKEKHVCEHAAHPFSPSRYQIEKTFVKVSLEVRILEVFYR